MIYDWEDLRNKIEVEVARSGKFRTIAALSEYLGVHPSTVRDAFTRGDLLYGESVGIDVPAPIQINVPSDNVEHHRKDDSNQREILFITDLHTGYNIDPLTGNPNPTHNRQFISDLMSLAKFMRPDEIVWGGDLLDFPDFGKYINGPETIGHLQLALCEVSYILATFSDIVSNQIYLEGNHEMRLRSIINRLIPGLSGLSPGNRPTTASIVSVPTMLGLDYIGVKWIGGYPDSHYLASEHVLFEHGNIVRSGGGRTAASIVDSASHSVFFGHIHRTELAMRKVPISNDVIWAASPGCACTLSVPGASIRSDWHIGALYISLDKGGKVNTVDFIKPKLDGQGITGGIRNTFVSESYVPEFMSTLPKSLARLLGE